MKLKNKELLVFFGGVLLLLLFLLVQPFLQTEKKQIAVILSENAVPSFGSFQEGIYDGAEDYAFALQIVHASECSEKEWEALLYHQKKQGCDGILLFCPEEYYIGRESFYAESLDQIHIPVFSVAYDPAFFHGAYSDGMEQLSEVLAPQIKDAEKNAFFLSVDQTQKKQTQIATRVEESLSQYGAAYDFNAGAAESKQTQIVCGEIDSSNCPGQAAVVIQVCPEKPDYTRLTNGIVDKIIVKNNYEFGYQAIAYLKNRIQGKNAAFFPPELYEVTRDNLFDAGQDALLFE